MLKLHEFLCFLVTLNECTLECNMVRCYFFCVTWKFLFISVCVPKKKKNNEHGIEKKKSKISKINIFEKFYQMKRCKNLEKKKEEKKILKSIYLKSYQMKICGNCIYSIEQKGRVEGGSLVFVCLMLYVKTS